MTELNSVKEIGAPDVLVVGAGPTGLALALDLTRRGVHALVVERAGTLFPGSRGKGLQPRTLEVFDDLGVGDAVREASAHAPLGQIWQDGLPVGEHDMLGDAAVGGPTDTEPHPRARLLPQWRTQEILYERLTGLGGRVRFDTALTGFEQDADGVSAYLSDGSVLRAAYLVAADGGRSTVRKALDIGMTGETVDPAPMVVADVRLRPGALDRDHWHLFPGPDGGFAALCPLPGTDEHQFVARTDDLTDLDVPAAVAALTHLDAQDVTEVRWASDFRPRAAMADRFRDGRVLLAGDAAHVHSPPAARVSTPACRTPTTSAGSSDRSCATEPTPRSWTPTSRSVSPSPRTYWACPRGSTAARRNAAAPPASSAWDTGAAPSPRGPRALWNPGTGPPTARCRTGAGSSTCSGDRSSPCWPSARMPNCPP